jgi:hypothetical protein
MSPSTWNWARPEAGTGYKSSSRLGAQARVSEKKEGGNITPPGEWSSFWVIRFTSGSFYFRVIGNNLEILS